ncbi:MAG: glycosyltransferase family 2 protein [Prevotella sp.]|nr:glycosyltransferase family 2 protein [Prevotella sp.]
MKVSVITVTWNSGATLRDTLESVLRQTYPDIEHIIVDGGSTDNTMALIKEYEPRYNGRLRYICEPDKGIYDAMNKGIRMATGNVVGMLNSDDFYTSDDVLTTVAATLKNDSLDAVYGDIHFVNDDDLKKCVRYYSSRPFRRWWMRFGFMPAHPSFYCRREVYMKYGTFDISYKVAADFECLLRLIFIHRIKIKYLPLDFVTMRTGGASTSGMSSHKRILHDHQLAFRNNGVYSNVLFEFMRYGYKICEMTILKFYKTRIY